MKIDRLMGILSVLLQEEKITAPGLAEKFEVSPRTIILEPQDIRDELFHIASNIVKLYEG